MDTVQVTQIMATLGHLGASIANRRVRGALRTVERAGYEVIPNSSHERRAAAERFASLMRDRGDVEGVWLDSLLPDLELTAVVTEPGLATEIAVRDTFTDVVCQMLDLRVGELSVYAVGDNLPQSVGQGELLT